MPSGEMLRVREVWHENLDAEMRIIEGIVEDYPFLAMDTEFPGVLALLHPGYAEDDSINAMQSHAYTLLHSFTYGDA